MKVLYISNRTGVNKQEALNWFQFYCENTDLFLFTDINSAKQFLTQEVIDKKKHLDLIITDWNFGFQNARELLTWLRESKELYSDSNFIFRSIPVILIEDSTNQSSIISEGFDGVIVNFPNDFLNLRLAIKSTIRGWRYSLADDLELIGLDPQTQRVYPGHRAAFISYYKLKVLSRLFVENRSKRLSYIWTNIEINPIIDSNEAFYNRMIRTMRNPPRNLEKEFHEFFKANPTFIKGEDFKAGPSELLYEKHLYKNGTRNYDEPDFINKPHEYALRYPEIFEIKRQSQRLLRLNHTSFISNAKKSFEQVKRYKAYFTSSDPRHQDYIRRYLGQIYTSYEYTLLMGSLNEKHEHENLIERLKSDFDFDDINLITYEELLDRHIRLCNRLAEFNIFD